MAQVMDVINIFNNEFEDFIYRLNLSRIDRQKLIFDEDGHPYIVHKDLVNKFYDSLENYEHSLGVFEEHGVAYNIESFRISTSDEGDLLVFSDSYVGWLDEELDRLYEIESVYNNLCDFIEESKLGEGNK